MKSLFQKYKWMAIVFGCLLLIAGIFVFIMAIVDNVSLTRNVFSIVVAVMLFIIAGLTLFSSLYWEGRKPFNASLMMSAIVIALGILLLIERELLPNAVVMYTGVLLIAISAVSLIKAIMAISYKDKGLYIFLFLLITVIGATLGGLILGFINASPLRMIIYIGLSIAIVVGGVISIIFGIKSLNKEPEKLQDDNSSDNLPKC